MYLMQGNVYQGYLMRAVGVGFSGMQGPVTFNEDHTGGPGLWCRGSSPGRRDSVCCVQSSTTAGGLARDARGQTDRTWTADPSPQTAGQPRQDKTVF